MGDEDTPVDELVDVLRHVGVARSASQACAGDAVDMHRTGIATRIDQCRPLLFDRSFGGQLCDRNLEHPIVVGVEAGRLDVDHGVGVRKRFSY
ncbi:hypothetical protein GCM10027572_08570 [Flexivirga lutea]